MRVRRLTRLVPMIWAVLATSGCNSDLSPRRAEGVLHDHLSSVLPLSFPGDSFNVGVTEVLSPSETVREARFRILPATDGVPVDSTEVLTATLQRSSRGWSVAGYGESLRERMAAGLAYSWVMRFEDLLTPLHSITGAVNSWEMERLTESTELSEGGKWAESNRAMEKYFVGPTEAQTKELLADSSVMRSSSIEWGFIARQAHEDPQVAWVRDRADTVRVCAHLDGSPRALVISGYWWAAENWDSCKDHDVRFDLGSVLDSAQAAIRRAGGVLYPAQSN